MGQVKPRVIKDFEKLDPAIQEQIKLVHPNGFSDNLITFTNKEGKKISALPFETDEKYYMVRMTVKEAARIIEDDDDYDDDGFLKDDIKEEYEDKYSELDYINESSSEEDTEKDNDDEDDDD